MHMYILNNHMLIYGAVNATIIHPSGGSRGVFVVSVETPFWLNIYGSDGLP